MSGADIRAAVFDPAATHDARPRQTHIAAPIFADPNPNAAKACLVDAESLLGLTGAGALLLSYHRIA